MMLSEIATYLAGQSIGTVDTDLFVGFMPDAPESCVYLDEYAGSPPEWTADGKKLMNPGLQIVARGTVYSTTRAKLQAIEDLLDGITNTTIGASFYVSIWAGQSIIPMGWAKGLVKLAQNYRIKIRKED
jgi:hypothetical protein